MQGFDALFGLTHPLAALKLERFGHNANRQHAQFAGCLSDDRGRTRTGAAAHTGGDKAHVRACQLVNDFFDRFFSGGCTHGGACARTQTFGHFHTHLDACRGFGVLQSLCVRVRHDEFNALQFLFDHVVDRVATGSANTKNGDAGFQLGLSAGHGEV